MRGNIRKVALATILVFATIQVYPSQESLADRFTAVAGRLVERINASDYERIVQGFGPQMREALPLEKLKPFLEGLAGKMGKIQNVGPPQLVPPNQAVFLVHFERGTLDMKLILDTQDRIAGFGFLPHPPPPAAKERNETRLRLPFRGLWLVSQGGDTSELNQHHEVPNQRFAFDFVGVRENGKTQNGTGSANEDHYAFGREVLAPADGVVTDVIEGVRDNVPGSLNPYSALGNAVLIQHREDEVGVLAHLKMGSIRVKVGDRVKAGQVIGLCGNSGNSSRPHMHFHLQNSAVIQDAIGIKVYFDRVLVTHDGRSQTEERHSPIRGDLVSPD